MSVPSVSPVSLYSVLSPGRTTDPALAPEGTCAGSVRSVLVDDRISWREREREREGERDREREREGEREREREGEREI